MPIAATKLPTTAQKGITKPAMILPRSSTRPVGTAGRTLSVLRVRSTHGIGMSCSGLVMITPVMVGTPT